MSRERVFAEYEARPPRGECAACHERYDVVANDGDVCLSCIGLARMISGVSFDGLPLHEVIEEGVSVVGQRYVRLRYADGSEDLIDPIDWDETVEQVGGMVARDNEDLS